MVKNKTRKKSRKKRGGVIYSGFNVGSKVQLTKEGKRWFRLRFDNTQFFYAAPQIPINNWVGTVIASNRGTGEEKGHVVVQWHTDTNLPNNAKITFKDWVPGIARNPNEPPVINDVDEVAEPLLQTYTPPPDGITNNAGIEEPETITPSDNQASYDTTNGGRRRRRRRRRKTKRRRRRIKRSRRKARKKRRRRKTRTKRGGNIECPHCGHKLQKRSMSPLPAKCPSCGGDLRLPYGWEAAPAPHGRTYYMNRHTGAAQWTRPVTAAVARARARRREGNVANLGYKAYKANYAPRCAACGSVLDRAGVCAVCARDRAHRPPTLARATAHSANKKKSAEPPWKEIFEAGFLQDNVNQIEPFPIRNIYSGGSRK